MNSSQKPVYAGPRYTRRRKLILPRLQLKIIGSFAGVLMLGMLTQMMLFNATLAETALQLPSGGDYLSRLIPSMTGKVLLMSLVLILPMALCFGVLITFRVAGPVYRFEQYLGQVKRGEAVEPCRIRRKDELQQLCVLINEGLEAAREQGRQEARSEADRAA